MQPATHSALSSVYTAKAAQTHPPKKERSPQLFRLFPTGMEVRSDAGIRASSAPYWARLSDPAACNRS